MCVHTFMCTHLSCILQGFHERVSPDDPKMYNTHAIVDAQGVLVAAYRKLHLFDVDYDGV